VGWDLGGDEGLDLLILNRVAVLGKEPNLREGEKGRGGEGRRYIGRERGEEVVREAQRGRGLKSSRQRYAAHGGYQCERSVHASARCFETLTTTLTLP
jgi:hypothetical protein